MSEITVRNGIEYTQATLVDSASGKKITKEMPISVLQAQFNKNTDGSYTVESSEAGNRAITTKTTTSFSAKESSLSDNEIAELVRQNLITYEKETGKCTLNNGQTIDNIKKALDEFNKTSPDENFTDTKTETKDIPTGQGKTEEESALLQGKAEVTTKSRNYKFNVTTTETTTEDYNVPTKEDLDKLDLNKRSVRKELKGQYRQALESWLAADPSHEEIMNDSIAAKKYSKKINKEIKKFDKKYGKPEAFIKDLFENNKYDKYITKEAKDSYNTFMQMAEAALKDPENNKDFIKKFQESTNITDLNSLKNDSVRKNVLQKYFANTIDKKTIDDIKTNIATDTVLNKRSTERKIEDREYFLDYMSKREVRENRDAQNIKNTTLYLTKEEAKAAGKNATDPKARHNFIGKAGLKLLKANPQAFGATETTETTGAGIFKANDGKYYKFDQKAYSDKMGKDYGNHATLSEIRNLNGENKNEVYLNEDGTVDSAEGIIGNGNERLGYWETRSIRNSIKATGRSTDKDYTNWKKLGDGLLKGAAVLGTTLATAGTGLLVGGTVSGIAQGAVQKFTIDGQEVYIKPENCTAKVEVNGRTYTVIQQHGDYYVTGDKQDIERAGQEVEYNDKASLDGALKVAGPAAALATIIGMATSKVRSKGDTDDVIDLRPSTRTNVTKQETENHSITRTSMKKVMYDINGNNQLNSSYHSEDPVTVKETYTTIGSDAEDRDLTKMANRKVKTNITNAEQLANVKTNSAQAVFANTKGNKLEVTPTVDKDGKCNYDQPKEVVIHDSSNGAEHIFKYVLLDQEKAKKDHPGLAQAEGPFYQLVSVTDKDGKDISNPDKQIEIKSLKVVPLESEFKTITNKDGNEVTIEIRRNDYKFYQNEHHPGNNHTSINNKKAGPKFWTGRR